MTNLAARTTYQLKKRGRSRNVWVTLAFLTPATALIGIFIGTPVVLTFLLSFTDAGLTGPLADPRISYAIQTAMEEVMTGQLTPQAAMDKYDQTITGIVGKKHVEVVNKAETAVELHPAVSK